MKNDLVMVKDTRKRLFEMMERVAGMPIINEINGNSTNFEGLTLPPGFGADDFITPDEMREMGCVPNATVNEIRKLREAKKGEKSPVVYGSIGGSEATPMEGVKIRHIPKEELLQALEIKSSNIKSGLPQGGGRNVDVDLGRIDTTTLKNMKFGTEGDYIITLDKLAKILQQVPDEEQLLGKNTKMEKSNFYNITLPALMSLIYNQKNGEFYVLTTCTGAGPCRFWCYAQMGNYIKSNPAVRLNMQKLNYLFNHYDEWQKRVTDRINSLKSVKNFSVRWHDAGDFISEKYLDIAIEVANDTKPIEHYAYTKAVSLVKTKDLPSNFLIRYSFGGSETDPEFGGDPSAIDRTKDYHADTVTKDVFKQYQPKRQNKFLDKDQKTPNPLYKKNQTWDISPENMQKLKQDIRNKYGLDSNEFNDRVLTHDEYMAMRKKPEYNPYDNIKKWIVVSKMGDTDIPAIRPDVLGVYNLQHNEE
jgi:hypothetical protein